jgi:hypothetical protein
MLLSILSVTASLLPGHLMGKRGLKIPNGAKPVQVDDIGYYVSVSSLFGYDVMVTDLACTATGFFVSMTIFRGEIGSIVTIASPKIDTIKNLKK